MALDHEDAEHRVQHRCRIHTETSAPAARAAGNTLKRGAPPRATSSAPESMGGGSAAGASEGTLDGALMYSPAKYPRLQDTPALSQVEKVIS